MNDFFAGFSLISINWRLCLSHENFLNSKWHRKSFLTIFFSGRRKNKTIDVATRNDFVFIKSSNIYHVRSSFIRFYLLCCFFLLFKLMKFNFIVCFFFKFETLTAVNEANQIYCVPVNFDYTKQNWVSFVNENSLKCCCRHSYRWGWPCIWLHNARLFSFCNRKINKWFPHEISPVLPLSDSQTFHSQWCEAWVDQTGHKFGEKFIYAMGKNCNAHFWSRVAAQLQ